MSETSWIFIAGILVATASYFSKNFIFGPLLEYRKVKGRIQNRLKYNANIITNGKFPKDVFEPIREEVRQLSCDLEERYTAISFGKFIPTLLNIPTSDDLNEAAKQLIFLSNSTGTENVLQNDKAMKIVKQKLKLL